MKVLLCILTISCSYATASVSSDQEVGGGIEMSAALASALLQGSVGLQESVAADPVYRLAASPLWDRSSNLSVDRLESRSRTQSRPSRWAFEREGLPVAQAGEIQTFEDARGSIILTPDEEGGGMHEVYVHELAYGLRGDRIVLVRLRGLFDDGREIDIDHTDVADLVDGPEDFVGHYILWGCGSGDQELLVQDIRYRVDADGRFRLATLDGVLPDGEWIHYESPPEQAQRLCDVENVNECVSDPDEPCDWGFCQGIIDCGCVGWGACVIRVKIKCNNNECYDPNVCVYNRKSGLCDCVKGKKHCSNENPNPSPGSLACSPDEGRTVSQNGHARMFRLQTDTKVANVDYAVELCRDATGEGNPCSVYINLWNAPDFPSFEGAELIDTQQDLVPHGTRLQRRTVQMNGFTAPAGNLVVEVFNYNAQGYFGFWPGSNARGQSAPSYLRAEACELADWTDLRQIGFPNVHYTLCFDAAEGGEQGEISCEDVRKFKAKCKRGKLKTNVILTDKSHNGETVILAVDDILHDLRIKGKKAKYINAGHAGNVTVELLEPFDCFEPKDIACGGAVEKECKYTTTAEPKLGRNCSTCEKLKKKTILCRGACTEDKGCEVGAKKTLKIDCVTPRKKDKPAYCTVEATGDGCKCIAEP